MGFPRIFFPITFFFLVLLNHFSFPQIIFKELPSYRVDISDSSFFGLSETRSIISLNGKWLVFSAKEEDPQRIPINVPSIFKGNADLVFERTFNLTTKQLSENKIKLYILGLNYFADIIVNDIVVYRHRGGEYPFSISLPRNILSSEKKNLLAIKLTYKLDSENTIPVKQRFLFPESYGGILKDIYLRFEPNISVSELNIDYKFNSLSGKLQLVINETLENRDIKKASDTIETTNEFKLLVKVLSPEQSSEVLNEEKKFNLKIGEENKLSQTFEIAKPDFWLPGFPRFYTCEISLLHGESVVDKIKKDFPIYFLSVASGNFELNGLAFQIKGVTYVPSFGEYGNLASFSQMEEDIKVIAQTGFNSVRFAKSIPHPYYLKLCEKYGLLSFIEIPVNYIPQEISSFPNFLARCKSYLSEFVEEYSEFGKFAAVGLGSSYLPDLSEHRTLLNELLKVIPDERNFLSYASFTGIKFPVINNLDLYGVEMNKSINQDTTGLSSTIELLGKGKIFISEATYFVSSGSSSGYVNEHTYEAQAKYFEDFLDTFSGNLTSGYFINSMFDYRGDFTSVISGYNKNNLYQIGLISENRKTDFLSYKVVKSKLQNTDRVTIPIGTKSDNAPIAFIIVGLVLALIIGVLVNSGRKFREDASRALLRPYNFFADVRDQRIISSYHSTVMAVVISVVVALLMSSLLYHLKNKIIFEKVLLSFGSTKIMEIVSYLAWNPFLAIIWLSVFFCFLLIILVGVIKFSSIFVKNRVYISSIYFSVVWALLPVVLLIPAGIILYKALDANVVNVYVYIILLLFAFWGFYRLVKGIYVIFDINPGNVYLYSIIVVVLIIGSVILYYELKNSFVEYLLLTFKQYNISDLL